MFRNLALDEKMAEFCGIIMGDGNLWTNGRKYEITITGSPKDRDYMDKIAEYARGNVAPHIYYRIRGRGLRLTIYSKELFGFLTEEIGIKSGLRKSTGTIPLGIKKTREYYLAFIRGFFDTDGSVFTSMKDGAPDYPTIEITNENKELILSIVAFLQQEGFRTTFRSSNTKTFKMAIHGKEMVRLWVSLIGSTHPRKRSKMESIIKAFT